MTISSLFLFFFIINDVKEIMYNVNIQLKQNQLLALLYFTLLCFKLEFIKHVLTEVIIDAD